MSKIIIGISGKAGSGKSFLAQHIASVTGIKLVKLDYQIGQIVNNPLLKRTLQKRIKAKIPKAHKDIQLFPMWRNLEKDFSKFEHWFIGYLLNRRVKKMIRKSKEPMVIDFLSLPMLKAAKKFNEVYLIKSDESTRITKIMERDDVNEQEFENVEKYLESYYALNDKFNFTDVIENNYQGIPEKVEEFILRLTSRTQGFTMDNYE